MGRSVNKVILVGNLGKDPEVRHFENGGSVAQFSLATTETYKKRDTGETVTMPTDWHNISIKRPGLAKVAEQYLKKGSQIYLEGKLRTRSYEQDGQTKYITEIVVDEFMMLGGRPGNEGGDFSGTAQGQSQTQQPETSSGADDLPF